MKLTTLLTSGGSLAFGFVLGSAAGCARYQQIKAAANNLMQHPKVQQVLFNVAGQAQTNASRLPGPAARLVDRAATGVQDKLTHPVEDVVEDHTTPVPTSTPPAPPHKEKTNQPPPARRSAEPAPPSA